MAHTEPIDVDRWVDERLATLTPQPWRPDAPARLAELHRRRAHAAARRVRWAGAAVVVTVICVSLPVTRAVGARCVGKCVDATRRVGQWIQGEPAASLPRVVGVTLGDIAPDLVGKDLQGAPVYLSSFRGRVVVLNFWATWCGPCRAEMPILNALRARFGEQDLVVIGVSMDADGWSAVSPFAAQEGITYPLAVGDDEVSAAYGGISELPTTFVINREGAIVVKRVGPLSENADYGPIATLVGR